MKGLCCKCNKQCKNVLFYKQVDRKSLVACIPCLVKEEEVSNDIPSYQKGLEFPLKVYFDDNIRDLFFKGVIRLKQGRVTMRINFPDDKAYKEEIKNHVEINELEEELGIKWIR